MIALVHVKLTSAILDGWLIKAGLHTINYMKTVELFNTKNGLNAENSFIVFNKCKGLRGSIIAIKK
jgi:hypothetical protein